MPFFDPPPPPPDDEFFNTDSPRVGRYAPGIVPLSIVLAENDQVAVMLEPLLVYPDGVSIRVRTYRRQARQFEFRQFPIGGTGLHGIARSFATSEIDGADEDARAQFEEMARAMQHHVFGEELRFGVQFPDGAKATNEMMAFANPFDRNAPPPTCGLDPGGGSGDDTSYETAYFLWPLPGPGTLLLACEWPEHGVPETTLELDTQPIIDAAARARAFWPEDDGLPSHITFSQMWRDEEPD